MLNEKELPKREERVVQGMAVLKAKGIVVEACLSGLLL